jgi:hypothetical protein
LIAYEIRSDAPAADLANAFVELADWHLLSTPGDRRQFEKSTNRALEIYERAYREVQPSADTRAWTTQIFSPDLPVTLPTNEPNPFASAVTAEPSHYIDVRFDVTQYGRGERIEVLDTSQGATRAEERDLVHLIETELPSQIRRRRTGLFGASGPALPVRSLTLGSSRPAHRRSNAQQLDVPAQARRERLEGFGIGRHDVIAVVGE